jgi:hypothetical protein
MISKGFGFVGIKAWYWAQGLLSMPIDNIHKSWEKSADMTSVSSRLPHVLARDPWAMQL